MNLATLNPLAVARILIILELVALAVSTAAASAVEVAIYLTFLCFAQLRHRVRHTLKQPMVVMTLVLWAMVGVGVLYSAAPFADALHTWGSWRKCLMLPLAAAVYDDPVWKKRFVWLFIGLMTFAAILSSVESLFQFTFITRLPIGIIISNHASQSMFFAAAAFVGLTMLRFHRARYLWLLWPCTGIIIANLFFITWGRSGYLAFLVCVVMLIFWGTTGRVRLFLLVVAPLSLVIMILLSPVARNGIQKGIAEMQTYETDESISSMGIRTIFWKNTFHILKKLEHPLIGYGTDGFKVPYAKVVEGKTGWQAKISTDPHNQYLKILVEHGGIGLTLFMIFIASFFRQNVTFPYYYLGIGILLAWSATSIFSGHFSTFHEGRFFFLWSGVMLSPQSGEQDRHPDTE